jgi:hypothetical protein
MKLNLFFIIFLGIIILISVCINKNLYEGMKKCALPQDKCSTFTSVNDGYLLDTTKKTELCEGTPCDDVDRTKCHKEATGQDLGYKCIKDENCKDGHKCLGGSCSVPCNKDPDFCTGAYTFKSSPETIACPGGDDSCTQAVCCSAKTDVAIGGYCVETSNCKMIGIGDIVCESGTCTDKRKKCSDLIVGCDGGKEKISSGICDDETCSNCCKFPLPKWAWRIDGGGPHPNNAEQGNVSYRNGVKWRAGPLRNPFASAAGTLDFNFGENVYRMAAKKGLNVGIKKSSWGTDNPYVFEFNWRYGGSIGNYIRGQRKHLLFGDQAIKEYIAEDGQFYDNKKDLPTGKAWWFCTSKNVGSDYKNIEKCWDAFKNAKSS